MPFIGPLARSGDSILEDSIEHDLTQSNEELQSHDQGLDLVEVMDATSVTPNESSVLRDDFQDLAAFIKDDLKSSNSKPLPRGDNPGQIEPIEDSPISSDGEGPPGGEDQSLIGSVNDGLTRPNDQPSAEDVDCEVHDPIYGVHTVSFRETPPQDEERDLTDAVEDTPVTSNGVISGTPTTHKQSQEQAIFNSLLRDAATKANEEVEKRMLSADYHDLSVRELSATGDSATFITDPREYQLELFERAKTQNTIAVLDTGSGKTMIAVLLLRHILTRETEDRAMGKPHQTSFFLVPTVPLVFQQSAVLETNLTFKVGRLVGDMNIDNWSMEKWQECLQQSMVFVCTLDVLNFCLGRNFVSMEGINLLVFDEAHHAKKEHAYAKLMKDYYRQTLEHLRPRIFGMTASPVDAKVRNIQTAIRDLEELLDCKIATAQNLDLLKRFVSRPREEELRYDRSHQLRSNLSFENLKEKYGEASASNNFIAEAKKIETELGRWCCDEYWRVLSRCKEEEVADKDISNTTSLQPIQSLVVSLQHLSPKVLQLHQTLASIFAEQSDARCIVFVERRGTAALLDHVFKHAGLPNLHSGYLLGVGGGAQQFARGGPNQFSMTVRKLMMTLAEFRKGTKNCIFATSVAEEGLDIPDCNVVIRFDLCETMMRYVQSRGRARHKDSTFIHMVENGNPRHRLQVAETRATEEIMRGFCNNVEGDRLLKGNSDDFGMLEPSYGSIFVDPSTGARLNLNNSLQYLSKFVSCLCAMDPTNSTSKEEYIMQSSGQNFICEVIIPHTAGIHSVIGEERIRKSLAKRSAAFKACRLLKEAGVLDDRFLPTEEFRRRLPKMNNARLAVSSKRSKEYEMMTKPQKWEQGRGTMPEQLHGVLLYLADTSTVYRPLVLLSRMKLPNLPIFKLWLSAISPTAVHLITLPKPLAITQERVSSLTSFTLRVFTDVFSKTFKHDAASMPYWLAPLKENSPQPDQSLDMIDWVQIRECDVRENWKWSKGMEYGFLSDKFIVDPFDGSRRFFSRHVRDDMKSTDSVPDTVKVNSREDSSSIAEFSCSLWKKARQTVVWNPDQPVFEAERVALRRNLLSKPDADETDEQQVCFLTPDFLYISTLEAGVVRMALVLPAIIHRLDSYLIALEVCETVGISATAELALQAITKDSDNSGEHGEQKVNFQRGMGQNYERLEFLGDAFLKTATTIAVYAQEPDSNENEYHVTRMLMLCNKNLFNTALQIDLYKYVRSMEFNRRTWYPQGLELLKGKKINKTLAGAKHALADKTIADVCEALIGAAFLTDENKGKWSTHKWANAVQAVSAFVNEKLHNMTCWEDYLKSFKRPKAYNGPTKPTYVLLADTVAEQYDYKFRSPQILRSAFKHPSYPRLWDALPSYQQLEFLGDALHEICCVTHLFYRYPDRDPQWLTEHKMAMVSNKLLGAVCVKLGFHRHLLQHAEQIPSQIRAYVEDITDAEEKFKDAPDYWMMTKSQPPKYLADMVEAFIGALFVDSDFNFDVVQRFFDTIIKPFFLDMEIYDTFANNHPVTKMYHRLDTLGCTRYHVLASPMPIDESFGSKPVIMACVFIHGKMIAGGKGSSTKSSKTRACAEVLESIQTLSLIAYREKFGCDCAHGSTQNATTQIGVTPNPLLPS